MNQTLEGKISGSAELDTFVNTFKALSGGLSSGSVTVIHPWYFNWLWIVPDS